MLATTIVAPHSTLPTKGSRKFFRACLFLIFCSLIYPAVTAAQDKTNYHLRAAYIYNFFFYINWPPHLEDAPPKNIVICVNSDDRVFKAFNDSLLEKTGKGKKLLLRRIRSAKDIPGCWIIYNNPSAEFVSTPDSTNIAAQGHLTIGENPGAMQETDIIRFYEQDGRLRFEISPSAASAAGFTISSTLLRLAKIIPPLVADKIEEEYP